jgi:hypothetical protein
VDESCPTAAQRRCGSGRRRSGRIHVVEQDHGRRDAAGRDEGTPDVCPPLGAIEPCLSKACLPAPVRGAGEERRLLERPVPRQLTSEALGRVVAPPELPRGVGRDRDDEIRLGSLDVGDDEIAGESRRPAEAVLLPRTDERPSRPGIRDCCAGRRERETTAGTLATALDRPSGRRTTASTTRSRKHSQARAAESAHRVGGGAARDATTGQEQVDEPRRPRYAATSDVSVPTS